MTTALEYLFDVLRDLLGNWLIKACGSTLFGVLLMCIGGRDKMLDGLFLLMCFDFVLGFAHGWKLVRVSKSKFMRGLAKFLLYYLTLFCAAVLDGAFNVKTEAVFHVDFRGFLILYLCLNEFISVLGHLHFFGMPLPEKLMRRLKDYRDCKLFSGPGLPSPGGKS